MKWPTKEETSEDLEKLKEMIADNGNKAAAHIGFNRAIKFLKSFQHESDESPAPTSIKTAEEKIGDIIQRIKHHPAIVSEQQYNKWYIEILDVMGSKEAEVNKLAWALKLCREMLVDKGLWGGNMINIKIDEIIKPYL